MIRQIALAFSVTGLAILFYQYLHGVIYDPLVTVMLTLCLGAVAVSFSAATRRRSR